MRGSGVAGRSAMASTRHATFASPGRSAWRSPFVSDPHLQQVVGQEWERVARAIAPEELARRPLMPATDSRGGLPRPARPSLKAQGAHPQRTRPQRSRQHQWQRRFPQRSRQQFRHLTRSRSLLGPLITLFDSGTMGMADPVVEAVASSSPANPIASAIFDMSNPPWRALSR